MVIAPPSSKSRYPILRDHRKNRRVVTHSSRDFYSIQR